MLKIAWPPYKYQLFWYADVFVLDKVLSLLVQTDVQLFASTIPFFVTQHLWFSRKCFTLNLISDIIEYLELKLTPEDHQTHQYINRYTWCKPLLGEVFVYLSYWLLIGQEPELQKLTGLEWKAVHGDGLQTSFL